MITARKNGWAQPRVKGRKSRRATTVSQRLAAMSDQQIARLLRKSDRQVRPAGGRRRQTAASRGSPRGWTVAEERLVGTMPDDVLARRIGRSRGAVEARRIKLKLPKVDLKQRPWTPKEDALLRNFSNQEIAGRTGRTVHSVENRRRRLGVPSRSKPWRATASGEQTGRNAAFWTKKEEALLGTMPDERLAKMLGRSVKAVRAHRHARRISMRKEWQPSDNKLLGKRPDRELARLRGFTTQTVSLRPPPIGYSFL